MKKLLIIPFLLFCNTAFGAITYFNSASNPADNGTNNTTPTVVTPPSSMVDGDLVLMIGHTRVNSTTIAVSETGGQSWSTLNAINGNTGTTLRIAWCRYNGTWSANPSMSFTGSDPFSVIMHVFRPSSSSKQWEIDTSQVELDFAAPSTPFTVTVTGINTTNSSTITLASWATNDDNSWTSLSGSGWVVTGGAQYRNTTGFDDSSTFAHYIQTSSGSTGNVSKNQTTVTGDAGTTSIVAWYEYDAGASRRIFINS